MVLYLNVVSVDVNVLVLVVEHGGRPRVARVAGHVVRHHQDDLGVRDAL